MRVKGDDAPTSSSYLGAMGKTKSERHHWWPECVSRQWADEAGGVHWIRPDGSETRARPDAFGVIGNGHFIKLGKEAGETTPWDQNFEDFFQQADGGFPGSSPGSKDCSSRIALAGPTANGSCRSHRTTSGSAGWSRRWLRSRSAAR